MDGYCEKTFDELNKWEDQLPLKIISQEKESPAKARNNGIKCSRNKLLWFLGDDCIVEKDCLEKMLIYADKYDIIQGNIKYPEEWLKDNFTYFLEKMSPVQNYFDKYEGKTIPFYAVSTSNLLVNKEIIAEAGLLDERFKKAIYEDTEWAFRLSKKSPEIVFAKEASVSHIHKPVLGDFCKRLVDGGYYAAFLSHLHPETSQFLNLDTQKSAKTLFFNKYTINLWFRFAKNKTKRNWFLFFAYRGLLNYHHKKGLEAAQKEGLL